MSGRSSHRFIWFEFGALLTLLALATLWIATQFSLAQEDNRQLKREQAQPNLAGQRRIALVIGNGAYTNAPPLKNPPNDARDMAATLKTLGFDVMSAIDINQRDIKRLIREFGQKLKGGGSGLFYYAGHGVQSKGHNYLIPVDAVIESEADVEDSGVDVNLVLNHMDDAQNGFNIVILDACRNNPFSRGFRSASAGLAQIDAPTGTLIAYATAPGSVASDGIGRNGLYTQELIKNLGTPGLGIEDIFKRVRISVRNLTQGRQTPWESSSLIGDFYFSGIKPVGLPVKDLAETTWRATPEEFEREFTFLNGGKFVWRAYVGTKSEMSGEGTWSQSGEDITMNIPNVSKGGKAVSLLGPKEDSLFKGTIVGGRIIGNITVPFWSLGNLSGGGESRMVLVRLK